MADTPSRTESMASSSAASVASSSTSSATTPTALPTEEALQILLSPDGYYKYLAIPKPEPSSMGLKYQEAMAAGGGATTSNNESGIDLDQVKKNYRRLSLKHHPDRRTGDAECFRMLNRAKVVLSSPKLRREYDLVGLDLEDDAEDADHHDDNTATNNDTSHAQSNGDDANAADNSGEAHHEDKDSGNNSKTETVMGHLASATLAGVLQVVVRTGMMGLVSVLISRYTILAFLAMGMLTFLSVKMFNALKKQLGPSAPVNLTNYKDALSPMIIALGVFLMYRGRRFIVDAAADVTGAADNAVVGDSSTETAEQTNQYLDWTWTFCLGETIVMTSFISNSIDNKRPNFLLGVFIIISLLLSLWLRGRFWRYATLLGFEGVIALLVVLAFPIMEMILESIVEEKMRKVGEKIRAHDVRMKELLRRKHEEAVGRQ